MGFERPVSRFFLSKPGRPACGAPDSWTVITEAINAGGHGGEAIPVPIPNTEVKLTCADDTGFSRESRKLPAFFFNFFLYTDESFAARLFFV